MKNIGLYIETKAGELKTATLGMITAVRQKDVALFAFLFEPVTSALKIQLETYGVTKIIEITPIGDETSKKVHPFLCAPAIIAAMEKFQIKTLVALSTAFGKTLLPIIAAELEAPLVLDCTSIDLENNIAQKILYSGKTVGTLKLSGEHFIFGLRNNITEPQSEPVIAEVIDFAVEIQEPTNFSILDQISGESNALDLSEAEIILSGGRGLENSENFNLLHDCAAQMNAAVGASRVAVDSGWVPYDLQVGQTGKKVSPKVYIACGISGSIQHFAGMKTSGLIIAINSDESSPMIKNSDYYAITDLFELIPVLTQKLAEMKNN